MPVERPHHRASTKTALLSAANNEADLMADRSNQFDHGERGVGHDGDSSQRLEPMQPKASSPRIDSPQLSTWVSGASQLTYGTYDNDRNVVFTSGIECCSNKLFGRILRMSDKDSRQLVFFDHICNAV
jgi:hypothetical protein